MKKQRIHAALPWIIPAAVLSGWFLASENGIIPGYLMPHPAEVAATAYLYIFGEPGQSPYAARFLPDAWASLVRIGAGFFIAASAGVPLGLMSGRLFLVHKLLSTTINGLRAVPGITWLPLAMVWFGIGMKTTVFLVAMAAFFPVYLNTASGAARVSPKLLQAGAMMGVGRLRGIFAILIPGAMPDIITGLRLGLGISWAYLVLGELTGVSRGLGAVIMDARMIGRIDVIVVGIIIIAGMGRISDLLLKQALKLTLKSAARIT